MLQTGFIDSVPGIQLSCQTETVEHSPNRIRRQICRATHQAIKARQVAEEKQGAEREDKKNMDAGKEKQGAGTDQMAQSTHQGMHASPLSRSRILVSVLVFFRILL